MKHYDIYLAIHVAGYEKLSIQRVFAKDEKDAIYSAFCEEAKYLNEEEVAECLKPSITSVLGYHLVDCDLSINLERVVELIEVPINVNGTDAIVLVPDPKTYVGQDYFLNK